MITGVLMGLAALAAIPPSPAPQTSVARMLSIEWSLGQDLPQGFQDSEGVVLGSRLVTVCGFCSGLDNQQKPGKYPRGFLRKGWALDLAEPKAAWRPLPDFPGAARQGLVGAPVGGALYVWGGFSYEAPYCYADGYRLSRRGNAWRWDPLPPLPYPMCAGAMTAMGSRIYLFGGADYDAERFYTEGDRHGAHPRRGAHLWEFDTRNPQDGWQRLPDCPGTPRWVNAMAAVRGRLYVIGGATGERPSIGYCTVVDNWRYDPKARAWSRLRDLPIASGNFPKGPSAFRNRYILLPGGYQYARVANPDGTLRAPYGTPTKVEGKGDYYADVFVYDTRTDTFGTADALPINNNLSTTIVHGDELLLIGGEVDARPLWGVFYGHHPDLFLRGRLRETAAATAGSAAGPASR